MRKETEERVDARRGEKVGRKGTERTCRCPKRWKSEEKGNRENVSIPEEVEKRGEREPRERVDARRGEKARRKGTERVSRWA